MSENKLWALFIVAVAIVLLTGIGAIYRANVSFPREMADKGYCWTYRAILGGGVYGSYQPCQKADVER